MPAAVKFNDYSEQKNRAVHNWGAHTFKLALTNTLPVAANTGWNVTDHPAPAAANGYAAGGGTLTGVAISETGGVTTVVANQVVFTATAGGIGPFRYYVLYNDTATSPAKAAVMFWDHGSNVTLNDGDTFTVKFNNATPGAIFTDS